MALRQMPHGVFASYAVRRGVVRLGTYHHRTSQGEVTWPITEDGSPRPTSSKRHVTPIQKITHGADPCCAHSAVVSGGNTAFARYARPKSSRKSLSGEHGAHGGLEQPETNQRGTAQIAAICRCASHPTCLLVVFLRILTALYFYATILAFLAFVAGKFF